MLADCLLCLSFLLLLRLGRSRRARPAFKWLTRAFVTTVALVFQGLLPLGPEDRVVRRQPWVTYSIVGLCVAMFQLQLITEPSPEWLKEYERARNDAVTYALERPYLTVPPTLSLPGGRQLDGRSAQKAQERPDGATLALEQAELDRRSETLYGLRRQMPTVRWGNVAASTSWRSQLTSAFVHGGWSHLLGNMVFLLAFGPFLEDVYGRFLFAMLYLCATFASAALGNASHYGTYVCSFGASGAISGVMGAFLVRLGSRRLSLLGIPTLWLPVLRVRVSVPAYVFLLLSFVWDIRGALRGIPGIGWWAHIGGFLFGAFFAGALHLTRIEKRLVNPGIEARLSLHQHPAVEKSFALRTKGRFESALRAVEAALAEQPHNLTILREAYDACVAAGRLERAGTHATRVLGLLATRSAPDDLRETVLFIEEAETTLGSTLPARFYFSAGDCLERQGQDGRALLFYEGLANDLEAPIARRGAVRRARLLQRLGQSSCGANVGAPSRAGTLSVGGFRWRS